MAATKVNMWLPRRPPPKSPFKRVEQWLTFARQWHLVDARWQDPDRLAEKIVPILKGSNKPIYHPDSDCGDHVIVYNCKHIAMKAFDWKRRVYWFDTRFPKGKNFFQSWLIHSHQPTRIMGLVVYAQLSLTRDHRRRLIERLHLFPEEQVPPQLLSNVSSQLSQVMPIPKTYDEYSEDQKEDFPALFDFPQNFTLPDNPGKMEKP